MAEINLLQNSKQSPNATFANKNSGTLNRWLNYIGIALLILAIGASIFLYFDLKNLTQTISSQQAQTTQLQGQITGAPDYGKLVSTQTKLKDLQVLLDNHLDWSQLLPKFFNATLKSVVYTKFTATSSGQAVVNGTVPNFVDLDKMIQGFQITPFDQYIKDVQLVNIGNSSGDSAGGGTAPGIQFTLDINFNNNILGLQVPAGTKTATPAMQSTAPAAQQSVAPQTQTPTGGQ